MNIEINTYFEEDAKEFAYCAMIKVLVKRLKKNTGIDLFKLDTVQANQILRKLIKDFYNLACNDAEDDELGGSWLCLAWDNLDE